MPAPDAEPDEDDDEEPPGPGVMVAPAECNGRRGCGWAGKSMVVGLFVFVVVLVTVESLAEPGCPCA